MKIKVKCIFQTAVADSTNKFYSIYSLVSQCPIQFDNETSKQNEDVVILDDNEKLIESSKSHINNENVYLYRNQIGERVFIPKLKPELLSNKINCKREEDTFMYLKKAPENVRQSTVQNIHVKNVSSSDDSDSDAGDVFFIDNKQDISLLSNKEKTNNKNIVQSKKMKSKKNNKKGISFNMSNSNQIDYELGSSPALNLHENTKMLNKISHKTEKNQKYTSKTSQNFNPLKIKTITSNSKKVKRKKRKK